MTKRLQGSRFLLSNKIQLTNIISRLMEFLFSFLFYIYTVFSDHPEFCTMLFFNVFSRMDETIFTLLKPYTNKSAEM